MLDFCIVGGGIVGLATGLALLQRFQGAGLAVVEQESSLGLHQTGHNSGVIHSGIYYAPGSLKARLCRAGAEATKAFCAEHGIPVEQCGKLLVATTALELGRMDQLAARAGLNDVVFERIDGAELRRREPHIAGLAALFVPATGIVDYRRICVALAGRIAALGGTIVHDAKVARIEELADRVRVHAGGHMLQARQMIACAGLQADRMVACAGLKPSFQIVPFRGEYFRLPHSRTGLIGSLIYPIPDPALPFLGIHLTRTIDGGITVGPNAVLGLAREKYGKLSVDFADLGRMLGFPGFWSLMRTHGRSGLTEARNSLWKPGYLAECRKYCPELTLADLVPQEAGIRAQAVLRDGTLVQDFLFQQSDRSVHVCNAPSPAATCALPIGAMIADRVALQRQSLRGRTAA
jgi:L-2-hydroxyglutarate oxidase